jgi:hypothetical protein
MIKSRWIRWAKNVARMMTKKKNACRILFIKPEGKRPLGTPRWVDNIKIHLREMEWSDKSWLRTGTS